MLETRYRAARALPLGAQTRTASAGSGVSVRPAGAEARFSLRARLAKGAAPKLAGLPHSLVNVSHRNVGIDVSGRQAAAVLNAGCPLDLSESAFPPGSATRTLLGKSEIVLIRASAAPLYRVECWRSFSTYVHGLLNEAVFGVEGSAAH